MQVVSFPVNNKSDINVLLEVIRKFGYNPRVDNDIDIRLNARKKIVQYSKSYKRLNIPANEIDKLIIEAAKSED
jgi:hypothetical protein